MKLKKILVRYDPPGIGVSVKHSNGRVDERFMEVPVDAADSNDLIPHLIDKLPGLKHKHTSQVEELLQKIRLQLQRTNVLPRLEADDLRPIHPRSLPRNESVSREKSKMSSKNSSQKLPNVDASRNAVTSWLEVLKRCGASRMQEGNCASEIMEEIPALFPGPVNPGGRQAITWLHDRVRAFNAAAKSRIVLVSWRDLLARENLRQENARTCVDLEMVLDCLLQLPRPNLEGRELCIHYVVRFGDHSDEESAAFLDPRVVRSLVKFGEHCAQYNREVFYWVDALTLPVDPDARNDIRALAPAVMACSVGGPLIIGEEDRPDAMGATELALAYTFCPSSEWRYIDYGYGEKGTNAKDADDLEQSSVLWTVEQVIRLRGEATRLFLNLTNPSDMGECKPLQEWHTNLALRIKSNVHKPLKFSRARVLVLTPADIAF